MKNTGFVVGVVLIVFLAVLLLGGVGMMGFGGFGMMGGYGPHGGMMGGYGAQGLVGNTLGMIISLVSGALLIGGVALLVVWFGRSATHTSQIAPSADAALEIVKTRYARGEITKEQFDTIKRDLET